MEFSDDAIVGGIVASVGGFFMWLVRLVSRQVMNSFDETMRAHADSISANTKELRELRREITEQRVAMADFNARLKAVEGGWEYGK